MPDIETLQIIWWVLLGVLLTGFALTDGFDLGAAILLPLLGKTDDERRLIINTIAPVWESNQVWLVLGAGAIFAAWPLVYAVAFSVMYIPMFLVLGCLIIRPVGLKFRSKMPSANWRNRWDIALSITSFVPSLVFGVAVANAMLGLPFAFAEDLAIKTQNCFLALFNPFTLLAGFVSLNMIIAHGAGYLRLKLDHKMVSQAQRVQKMSAMVALFCFIAAGFILYFSGHGFHIEKMGINQNVFSKVVKMGFIKNHVALSAKFINALLPAMLACVGFVVAIICNRKPILSFVGSCLAIIGVIATAGFAAFPFILPSILEPSHSLTVWDASSSKLTLLIMLITVCIFLPIVLSYIVWTYRVFAKRLRLDDLNDPQMY
jgi:cytochrome d ubiquinol oxidase subunit II